MSYKYECNACGDKSTKRDPYGDYDCAKPGCNGHLAYYVDMPAPDPVCEGRVINSAVANVVGGNKDLAGALRMVFNRTAGGRSAPDNPTINHIHIGGNAQWNLLFDTNTYTVLGLVDGHMEKGMKPSVASQANTVNQRLGGASTLIRVIDDRIERG